MARIVARKGKKKISYSVTIRLKGEKSITRSFDTKSEERTWAAEVETEIKNLKIHAMPK